MLLLFTAPAYYPECGADDLTAIVDSIEQVTNYLHAHMKDTTNRYNMVGKCQMDFIHVFNTETGEITDINIIIFSKDKYEILVSPARKAEGFGPL